MQAICTFNVIPFAIFSMVCFNPNIHCRAVCRAVNELKLRKIEFLVLSTLHNSSRKVFSHCSGSISLLLLSVTNIYCLMYSLYLIDDWNIKKSKDIYRASSVLNGRDLNNLGNCFLSKWGVENICFYILFSSSHYPKVLKNLFGRWKLGNFHQVTSSMQCWHFWVMNMR